MVFLQLIPCAERLTGFLIVKINLYYIGIIIKKILEGYMPLLCAPVVKNRKIVFVPTSELEKYTLIYNYP